MIRLVYLHTCGEGCPDNGHAVLARGDLVDPTAYTVPRLYCIYTDKQLEFVHIMKQDK